MRGSMSRDAPVATAHAGEATGSGRGQSLLSVENLRTHFFTYQGVVQALNGVSFDIRGNEAVGLVGETGCGKSLTALSVMRLVEEPGRILDGEVWFEGKDLLQLTEAEMRRIRGNRIAMIFQDPSTYLNPVFTIGNQIGEVISLHQRLRGKELNRRVVDTLHMVRMPDPERVVRQYPHQLSGGMRQRCLIAMAVACNPKLIIADEPTTALDVTVQAAILLLLGELRQETGGALLLITHNLGIVAEICDRVIVMYSGDVVEASPTRELFFSPAHPYTNLLLEAVPKLHQDPSERLPSIPGSVPNLIHPPSACRFHPRCPHAREICATEKPLLQAVSDGHMAACHLWYPPRRGSWEAA